MTRPTLIALDADDTLWHNETLFRMTQQRFHTLLAPYAEAARVEAQLAAVEQRNLKVFGYGAKGFMLSMLETAIELSAGSVPATVLAEIMAAGRELMTHPIQPLPGVRDALQALAQRAPLVLVTKGDLFHQESKLAASGLGELFSGVEIVSEKHADTYRRVFRRHNADPERSMMIGNSVRSDILPALEAGSHAVLIPYPLVWAHEAAEAPRAHPRFRQFDALGEVVPWLDNWA
ncbi:HAD family hydrolase [Aquabacterium sp.]|uniref:HAD family hydrolase n=1 Tax=Aquabacterium sp. TaxID=1872578 RepID=UPI00378308F9